jgi:hypothetical protein
MRNHVSALVGTDDMGDIVLDLLIGSILSPPPPTTTMSPECDVSRFFATKKESPN